ncbi:MAG: MopE-related protein [Myxococcota bacterium]
MKSRLMMMLLATVSAALGGLVALGGTARAQIADCDLGALQVDLFIHLRFEKFDNCGGTTGISCTQDPDEQDLVGWGVSLDNGADTGVTDATGQTKWNGNGQLTNTCVAYGQHSVTFTVPSPSPYDAAASWPSNLTFTFTITPLNAQGNTVERFFFGVNLGCGCASDNVFCTLDTCLNGTCPYPPRPFDPTRAEVCNGADDDCDGQTDEGLPPTVPACNLASSIGCADKTREGFMTWSEYPLIAACAGAWSGVGADGDALLGDPSCNHLAGNFGTNASGAGCHAADLCPTGWHICYGPDDVAQRVGGGGANACVDAVDPFYPNFGSGPVDSPDVTVPPGGAFFATRAQAGALECSDGVNGQALAGGIGVFGCGNMGATVPAGTCGPLDRQAGLLCGGLRGTELLPADDPATDFGYAQPAEWAWSCSGVELQDTLVKTMPDRQGGVLCCKDTDPSLTEVCDGIDNDGDGRTDESVQGADGLIDAGAVCHIGQQCGTLECTVDGGWACTGAHACDDTTCDGVDDDQDGDTDEDYVAPTTHCGTGACARTGSAACSGGTVVDSCAPGPKSEAQDLTCDGQDGDCDGQTDEDFVASATSCGRGACLSAGVRTCDEGVPGDTCVPGTAAASDATCNGVDDDCDGTDDEGFVGAATSCGLGACARSGTETCVGGAVDPGCTPGGKTEADDATCDGVDGDCDGDTDEGFVASATTCGVGACAGNEGHLTCAAGVPGDTCDPLAGASSETCDGADDDCDGETDEGFGVGDACDGPDDDQCDLGVTVCGEDGQALCDETGPNQVEVCDGKDNDCDGETDEGLAASGCTDRDEDSIPDQLDNCVDIPNTDQSDKDGDHIGDVCDVLAQGGACAAGGAAWPDAAALALALAWLARLAGRDRRLARSHRRRAR